MDRDALAQLIMASMRGNHPMGGQQPYTNERLEHPQPLPSWLTDNPVPEGWMPPGANYNRPPPPMPPDEFSWQAKPAPKFHVPPGKELKQRGLEL